MYIVHVYEFNANTVNTYTYVCMYIDHVYEFNTSTVNTYSGETPIPRNLGILPTATKTFISQ